MRIVGHSMSPSLSAGALVFVDEAAYESHEPRRGEIVAARPARLGGRACVKRVAGLPSEQVCVEDQRWQLGPDDYFLLGDDAQDSLDSRQFGPVNRSELMGRVWWRWPWPRVAGRASVRNVRGST